MGFRFNKRIRLGKGISLNFGKRGPSLSVGGKGVRTNVSRKGVRNTIGIPGTGVSYSTSGKGCGCMIALMGFLAGIGSLITTLMFCIGS